MNVNELKAELTNDLKTLKNKIENGNMWPMTWEQGITQQVMTEFTLQQINKLDNLEYNRKVKVPQFVAHWLETKKDNEDSLHVAIDGDWQIMPDQMKDWPGVEFNDELFARAWLDGYEVDEEPKWVVRNCEGKFFCTMGFSTNQNKISNVIWQRDKKFEFKTKQAAEAVTLLVGGTVEERGLSDGRKF